MMLPRDLKARQRDLDVLPLAAELFVELVLGLVASSAVLTLNMFG